MEQETATLILSTFDITSVYNTNNNLDNIRGTIINNRCNFTWKI